MAINLATKFSAVVDEKFYEESKAAQFTNKDYDFVGAKTIKIYSVGVAQMNDYGRNTDGTSRYGTVKDLSNEVQEISMERDRSFVFSVDKMDEDETLGTLNAGTALARQLREVVTPEIDEYTFGKICAGAGNGAYSQTITSSNAYTSITDATEELDKDKVPMEGRIIACTPSFYKLLKQDGNAVLDTEIGQDARIKGVLANMDGMPIVRTTYLPSGVNFVVAHPVATTLALKLAEYKVHNDAIGVSGAVVEGRVYYTAFVRNNKKNAIYLNTQNSQSI